MWFAFSWPFNFHSRMQYLHRIFTRKLSLFWNYNDRYWTGCQPKKKLKQDQILDIVLRWKKYKGWLRSFCGKRFSASHCTGHIERTALQRQDLQDSCQGNVFEPRVITRPHPDLMCARTAAPHRTGSPPEMSRCHFQPPTVAFMMRQFFEVRLVFIQQ